jgi:hypothetical protein
LGRKAPEPPARSSQLVLASNNSGMSGGGCPPPLLAWFSCLPHPIPRRLPLPLLPHGSLKVSRAPAPSPSPIHQARFPCHPPPGLSWFGPPRLSPPRGGRSGGPGNQVMIPAETAGKRAKGGAGQGNQRSKAADLHSLQGSLTSLAPFSSIPGLPAKWRLAADSRSLHSEGWEQASADMQERHMPLHKRQHRVLNRHDMAN